jgi:hypothetical protein
MSPLENQDNLYPVASVYNIFVWVMSGGCHMTTLFSNETRTYWMSDGHIAILNQVRMVLVRKKRITSLQQWISEEVDGFKQIQTLHIVYMHLNIICYCINMCKFYVFYAPTKS